MADARAAATSTAAPDTNKEAAAPAAPPSLLAAAYAGPPQPPADLAPVFSLELEPAPQLPPDDDPHPHPAELVDLDAGAAAALAAAAAESSSYIPPLDDDYVPPPPDDSPSPRSRPKLVKTARVLRPTVMRLFQRPPQAPAYKPLSESGAAESTDATTIFLIQELLAEGEIALWHGAPRAGKSLLLLRLLIDLACDDSAPAFGCDRFPILAPRRVIYFTEEDSLRLIHKRRDTMLAGRPYRLQPFTPLAALGDRLWIVSKKGLTFDTKDSQTLILREIAHRQAELAAFDPVRSFTVHCDQGPSELRPVVLFLRELQRNTSAKTLLLSHHSTKASRDGVDRRARSERVSGGGIVSVCESPIAFERVPTAAGASVACYPEGFKDRESDPAPFVALVKVESPTCTTFTIAPGGEFVVVDQKILDTVRDNPGSVTNTVCDISRLDRNLVCARLSVLEKEGRIKRVPGPRRALFHYLADSNTTQITDGQELLASSSSGISTSEEKPNTTLPEGGQ